MNREHAAFLEASKRLASAMERPNSRPRWELQALRTEFTLAYSAYKEALDSKLRSLTLEIEAAESSQVLSSP